MYCMYVVIPPVGEGANAQLKYRKELSLVNNHMYIAVHCSMQCLFADYIAGLVLFILKDLTSIWFYMVLCCKHFLPPLWC